MSGGLSLETVTQHFTVIEGREADRLRAAYINRFVDIRSDYFRTLIAQPGPQGVSVCYTGYLWDTLRHADVISEAQLLARLKEWDVVDLFWDLHNARKVHVPNYWKFPLKAVLRGRSIDLLGVLDHDSHVGAYGEMFLPEDVYIFEETMKLSLILTHESTEDQQRWCLLTT